MLFTVDGIICLAVIGGLTIVVFSMIGFAHVVMGYCTYLDKIKQGETAKT